MKSVTSSILKKKQELYPEFAISAIRYLRFALNPVWVVLLYPVYVISGWRQKKSKGGPSCNIGKFSKKRYIRYTLHPEFVIFGLR